MSKKIAKITVRFDSSVNLAGYSAFEFKQFLQKHGATNIEMDLTFEKPKKVKV